MHWKKGGIINAKNGQSATSEKQEEIQTAQRTEEQTDIEVETELPESVSAEEQEADVSTKILVVYASKEYVEDWIGEIGIE